MERQAERENKDASEEGMTGSIGYQVDLKEHILRKNVTFKCRQECYTFSKNVTLFCNKNVGFSPKT